MNLLEHESKTLLKNSSIPVPAGTLFSKTQIPTNLILPVILKSQVPTGGRGKAGGILKVTTQQELQEKSQQLFQLAIKGYTPQTLLAEELLNIKKEFYLSLLVDRKTASLKLIAHTNGGIEVEAHKNFASWLVEYSGASREQYDQIGQEIADYYCLQDQTFALQDLIQNLVTCMKQNDATLIEINPLVLTQENKLIAGDCKITLDDAAAFRHPDWNFETAPAEANFVTINPDGNVATIANGAGLAMATVDAVYAAGLRPANFLDIGGGANVASLIKAFERILEITSVQAIIINVFAGITQADEVARAIIEARSQLADLPPLFIRLKGTNYQQAQAILKDANIELLLSLEACVAAAHTVIK